jgi:hypothetical protein
VKNYREVIEGKIYRYFYDRSTKFWIVCQINAEGDQLNDAEYYNDRDEMLTVYPKFTFLEEI